MRHGSLAAYLDYNLAGGNGRVLLHPQDHGIIGYLAFRYDQRENRPLGETIYLSTMAVTESRMGLVLTRLFQAMVKQVERDGYGPPERIWAKTWQQNRASARTLSRMGLRLAQTIPADPVFLGCRDTLIFEGSWESFARTAHDSCCHPQIDRQPHPSYFRSSGWRIMLRYATGPWSPCSISGPLLASGSFSKVAARVGPVTSIFFTSRRRHRLRPVPATTQRLAARAEEGGALGLHDAPNFDLLASGTHLPCPVVDSMAVLIAAGAVQSGSIGAVRQGGTLVSDRLLEHVQHTVGEALPLAAGELIAAFRRVDPATCRISEAYKLPTPARDD